MKKPKPKVKPHVFLLYACNSDKCTVCGKRVEHPIHIPYAGR